MTRCIQIGTTTIQGPLVAGPYPDPKGEHGVIVSRGWRYTGRLVESKREARDADI